MAERKAFQQLDPVRMSRGDFDALPLRREIKGAPKSGDLFRDTAYPDAVFRWKAYDAPVKGEWGKADAKKAGDPSKLPAKASTEEYKDGAVYRNEKGEPRVWRAYPKGQEILGEWQMGAAVVRE